ncbi:MAG: rubredoxin [Desulfosudaceae bacterium]
MDKKPDMYQCCTVNCGYIYNSDKGDRKGKIPQGTRFADLPEEWRCPICGASKKSFSSMI